MFIKSLLFLSLLSGQATASSSLVLPQCKFADTYQFGSVKCAIEFRNTGSEPISISDIKPGSSRDSISPTALTVPPRGTAYATAVISPSHEVGRIRRIFRFHTTELGQSRRTAEAMGFVESALDEPKPVLTFGVVNTPGPAVERTLRLGSREVTDFKIKKILATPAYIDAHIGPDGRTLLATVKADAPWGLHEADYVKLSINTPNQPEVLVGVQADVHGDVVPSSNPFSLGLFRKGAKNEFVVRLTSRSGNDYAVGNVSAEGLAGSAVVEPCVPLASGCKLIRFRVSDEQQTGPIAATLNIELPELSRVLPVTAWGMLVGKDTKVRDFNAEMQEAADAQGSSSAAVTSASPRVDLRQALKKVGNPTDDQPPPLGSGPLLKWSVLHEALIHGYVIYRSDTKTGQFVRVNADTILATSVAEEGASYQWRDTNVVSGRTYWYYIGLLNNDGSKSNLTDPQEVIAK